MRRVGVLALMVALHLALHNLAKAQETESFVDVHIHYNWDQLDHITTREIVKRLERANVEFAVATSTPSRLVDELKLEGGDRVIAFFSPYLHEDGRRDWFVDEAVIAAAEEGLKKGRYEGVGEIHFMSGFRPKPNNRVFERLMGLAAEYEVPALVHVDAGSERAIVNICSRHPAVNILFAHAGGNLRPKHVEAMIEKCPRILIELSARDPWRYGRLTDDNGKLLPKWRDIIVRYPHRFVVGTDPVWRVTRTQSWDEIDEGWNYFGRLIQYHRGWLAPLPAHVRRAVARDNAARLFGRL